MERAMQTSRVTAKEEAMAVDPVKVVALAVLGHRPRRVGS